MLPSSDPRHRRSPAATRVSTVLVLAGILGALLLTLRPAAAHTPHDDGSDIVLSPSFATDRTIWAITGNRLLRSTDAGVSWDARVLGLPRAPEIDKSLSHVAIVAEQPHVMYVTSRIGGLFRSDDGGLSWHSAVGFLPTSDLNTLAVSPTDPDTVFVGGSLAGGFLSVDGGRTWQLATGAFVSDAAFDDAGGRLVVATNAGVLDHTIGTDDFREIAPDVRATAVSLADGVLHVGTDTGDLLRAIGDGELEPIGRGLPDEPLTSIDTAPGADGAADPTVWVVAGSSGVYRSTDGGDTFRPARAGLTTDEQADEVGVSQFRTVEAGTDPDGDVQLFAAGFDGIFRSDDGGRSWRASETLADYIVGLDVSPNFATDRTVVAVTYVKGAYLSTDGGATWTSLNDGIAHDLSAGNKIAQVRRLHNVVFSPDFAADGLLFSATWTTFLRGTVDDGWDPVVVASPSDPALRQFVMGVSPSFARDRTIYLGTRQGTVYRSERAGEEGSWEQVAELGSRVRTVAVGSQPDGGHVLYASTVEGVRRSDDRGQTWQRTGPDGVAVLAMSPGFASDGTVFAGTESGLFATRDDGRTWAEVALPLLDAGSSIEAVGVSPAFADDGTVLVSVTGTGLFRSTDGGASFEPIAFDLAGANHVIADYTNPTGDPIQFSPSFATDRTVFAYADRFVLRSTDGGETWELLELPSLADFLLETDPQSLAQIVTDVPVPDPPRGGPLGLGAVAVIAGVAGLGAATAAGVRRRPGTT